mgnify:CR=1 FL=1
MRVIFRSLLFVFFLQSGLAQGALTIEITQGVDNPTAIAVVLPDFPANKRSTVIGITGATGALGAVVGPDQGQGLRAGRGLGYRASQWYRCLGLAFSTVRSRPSGPRLNTGGLALHKGGGLGALQQRG